MIFIKIGRVKTIENMTQKNKITIDSEFSTKTIKLSKNFMKDLNNLTLLVSPNSWILLKKNSQALILV
jgi:hypothetical protein